MNPLMVGISAADLIVKLSTMYSQKVLTEQELLALVSACVSSVKVVNTEWEKATNSQPVGGA